MLTFQNKVLLFASKYLPLPQKMKWHIGLKDEVAFWDGFIASNYAPVNGVPPTEEGRKRCDPNSPLNEELRTLVSHLSAPVLHVLDIGSGPLTRVGKTLEGKRIDLICVDPLADIYAALCRKHGVTVPVPVRKGEAENLGSMFAQEYFDLIHANNCLDHAYDPVNAIQLIVDLLRPGCSFYLRHEINVAQTAGYMGLHQWNFRMEGNDFVIAGRNEHGTNMNTLLRSKADIRSHIEGKFLVNIITRAPRA
jgi:SAM-dependent methyltransferase